MCEFVSMMEKLKSSSINSVANEEFTDFNEYMHTTSKLDEELTEIVREASGFSKALVLVCGNSGDGKSHLIANLKKSGVIDNSFEVYIDATSADKKGMKANDKLREKLMELSDNEIENGNQFRIVVAINLGILNDFLKNYAQEFTYIKKYVDKYGLFGNVPTWKYKKIKSEKEENSSVYIGHIDFTSFRRYEITPNGLNLQFVYGLLEKIISRDSKNKMRESFNNKCEFCSKRSNCPVYFNYKKLSNDAGYRKKIVDILAETIIKHNISPSVRDINNFFYEIIVGNKFDESKINSKSIDKLVHFLENLSLNLLYDGKDGLLRFTSELDALNDRERKYDEILITLNLKPSFERWIEDIANGNKDEFEILNADLKYCQVNCAKEYKVKEADIKRGIFKYYIRFLDFEEKKADERYTEFLKYIYAYNVGDEKSCKDLIELIKYCVYTWNGRLGNMDGENIKNAVIYGKGTDRYYLYKIVSVTFKTDNSVEKIDPIGEYPYFLSCLKMNFSINDNPTKLVLLDVDFELFDLLKDIREGYIPTDYDRKKNVNFDSFVRTLVKESKSDIYVYSRYENGKTYQIEEDEFGTYTFKKKG